MRHAMLSLATLLALAMVQTSQAQNVPSTDVKEIEKAVNKAIEYLEKSQAADGSFSKQTGPAVTALIATGIIKQGRPVTDPVVAKGLKFLETYVQPDGGICGPESNYKNYETCLGVMAFSAANKDGKYDKILKDADKFLKNLQWDGEEGHDKSSPAYGGAGYGGHKRPDLSNTGFLIDALKATGNAPDSEAMQKALIFVSRCQNLEGPNNTTPAAAKVNDGGFYYTAFGEGDSQAGKTENGGLRSYASMTYAGLKSMIFAGVKADDPRVKAAFEWSQKNYDLKSNPGMNQAGLFYYYHTLAKALDALGVDEIKDAAGNKHLWRQELVKELLSRQDPAGSWTNAEKRWMEGDPNLVTGYVLLTLSYAREKPASK